MLARQAGRVLMIQLIHFVRAPDDIEQTAAIGADHLFGSGLAQRFDLVGDDGGGNVGMAHGKRAAEPAAFFNAVLLHHRHIGQSVEQRQTGFVRPHFPSGVAGGVQGDCAFFLGVLAAESHHLHQEFGQFVNAGRQGLYLGQQDRIVSKQLGIMVAHHGGAGPGRDDDRPIFGKDINLLSGNGAGLIGIAAGISGLAATGLAFGEQNFDAFPFQKHGTLKGTLRTVSKDTFRREVQSPNASATYYSGRINLGQSHLDALPPNTTLLPGMTLAAELVVGKRSVMSYLLWPLTKATKEAIREP